VHPVGADGLRPGARPGRRAEEKSKRKQRQRRRLRERRKTRVFVVVEISFFAFFSFFLRGRPRLHGGQRALRAVGGPGPEVQGVPGPEGGEDASALGKEKKKKKKKREEFFFDLFFFPVFFFFFFFF